MERHTETEKKILASAEKVFYRKGKAGTSMQDIADDAGINRTLLNYYYRTKDQLFDAVFREAMGRFVPDLAELLQSDMPVGEYIPLMVGRIISTMIENPQIPAFVIQELNTNPDRLPQLILGMGINPAIFIKKVEEEWPAGFPSGMDPRQVIINLLSMCIFPFAARPVITEILYGGDADAFLKAMEERKKVVPHMVRHMIMMQKPMS
jgi:AcrR family transcriptional regulator